jgi:hypothetical protein
MTYTSAIAEIVPNVILGKCLSRTKSMAAGNHRHLGRYEVTPKAPVVSSLVGSLTSSVTAKRRSHAEIQAPDEFNKVPNSPVLWLSNNASQAFLTRLLGSHPRLVGCHLGPTARETP